MCDVAQGLHKAFGIPPSLLCALVHSKGGSFETGSLNLRGPAPSRSKFVVATEFASEFHAIIYQYYEKKDLYNVDQRKTSNWAPFKFFLKSQQLPGWWWG